MLRFFSYILFFIIILISSLVCAEEMSGFGGMAKSMMEPVNILSDFVSSVALILGIMFIFGSFIKYLQYRVNPLAVPISTVVFLLICGIVLVLLPLAYKLAYTVPPSYQVEHKPWHEQIIF